VIDSSAPAAWIAQLAFWAIFLLGIAFRELGRKSASVCLVLWALGFFGLRRLSPEAGLFVTPYVAVLDIVLAFIVFKGDVRLS
jgi:hypothetical protein